MNARDYRITNIAAWFCLCYNVFIKWKTGRVSL